MSQSNKINVFVLNFSYSTSSSRVDHLSVSAHTTYSLVYVTFIMFVHVTVYVCELLYDKSNHNRVGFARVTSAALCLVPGW
jgi:hypothetical protein